MDKKKYKFSKKTAAKFVFVIIAVAVVYSLFTNISHRKIDNGEEVIAEGEAKLTLVNVQNGQAALIKTPEGYYFLVTNSRSYDDFECKNYYSSKGTNFSLLDHNNIETIEISKKYFHVICCGKGLSGVFLIVGMDAELALCNFTDPNLIELSSTDFTINTKGLEKAIEELRDDLVEKYDIKE
ncbi:MAG: hypothetical protein ISS77_02245 [Phycisphaerae bacterium]|nr:hypothetical protein [Phycisphaerae bacterium]